MNFFIDRMQPSMNSLLKRSTGNTARSPRPWNQGPVALLILELLMTSRSRIAAFLSVSALTLGLAAAPAAFAADASTTAKPKSSQTHKHKAKKSGAKSSAKTAPATPAK